MSETLDVMLRDDLRLCCKDLSELGAELLARLPPPKGYTKIGKAREDVLVAFRVTDGDVDTYTVPIKKFTYEALKRCHEPEDVRKFEEIFERHELQQILIDAVDVVNKELGGEGDDGKHALTLGDFERFLDERGITIQTNAVTRDPILSGYGDAWRTFPTWCYSELVNGFSRITPNTVNDYAQYYADKNAVNPVWERIRGAVWDGKDRIELLCDALRVPRNDALSRVLVRKFLYQAILLVLQEEIPGRDSLRPAGVLVLPGVQGSGKSTFLQVLTFRDPTLTTDQPLNPDDKDSVSRCTAVWLGELGELNGITRRADRERLKRFLTSPRDRFRPPYGRSDVDYLRRTSYIATTNDEEFLDDPTGNRRWWTICCDLEKHGGKYDWDAENALDMVQLWRQAYEQTLNKGAEAYNLTPDELEQLNVRNAEHEKSLPGEDELRDFFERYQEYEREGKGVKYVLEKQTASEIRQRLSLYKVTPKQIGEALVKMGFEKIRATNERGIKNSRLYLFPRICYTSTSTNAELEAKKAAETQ